MADPKGFLQCTPFHPCLTPLPQWVHFTPWVLPPLLHV